MQHIKREIRTEHPIITLSNEEIGAALMAYARDKLQLTGGARSVEPPYFQAESVRRCTGLCGPLHYSSVVQLVFDIVVESEAVSV